MDCRKRISQLFRRDQSYQMGPFFSSKRQDGPFAISLIDVRQGMVDSVRIGLDTSHGWPEYAETLIFLLSRLCT